MFISTSLNRDSEGVTRSQLGGLSRVDEENLPNAQARLTASQLEQPQPFVLAAVFSQIGNDTHAGSASQASLTRRRVSVIIIIMYIYS